MPNKIVCFYKLIYYRGESLTVQNGKVTASAWMDNKLVMVMSTNNQPSSSGVVLRRQKDGSRIEVPCPEAVINYNKYMGGVDRGDQNRVYYSCRMKSRKFYKYIFLFLLDVAITNSYILHKHYSPTPIKTVKEFRLQLARELLGDYCSRHRPGRTGGIQKSISLRHFPSTINQDDSQRAKRGRCEQCKANHLRKDSAWFCRECCVWLCHNGQPDDCYLQYHKKIIQD